jgi:hypothetical protein
MKIKVSYFLIMALALSSVSMMGVTVSAKRPLWCEKEFDFYTEEPTVRGWISGGIDGIFVGGWLVEIKLVGQVEMDWGSFEIWDETGEVLLLSGTYKATSTFKNNKFRVGGPIEWVDTEFEDGRYADLLGRRWWAQGTLGPGDIGPIYIHGIDRFFRVN